MAYTEPLMLVGNYGLHLIKNPAGTYSFVGSIPAYLGQTVKDGFNIKRFKTPVFKSYEEGISYFKQKTAEHIKNTSHRNMDVVLIPE